MSKATARWREPGTAIVHALTIPGAPQGLIDKAIAINIKNPLATDCGKVIPVGRHPLSGERVNCVPCLEASPGWVQRVVEHITSPLREPEPAAA